MEKKNIAWIDNLRVISVLAVMIIHIVPGYVYAFEKHSWWHAGNVFDSLCRFCVPVFIMISGVLWFSDPSPAKVFYKKKVSRLILPFLFWSIISYLFSFFYLEGNTDCSAILTDFYEKFRTAQIDAHFWYIYMLIGLFLIAPVFKTWISNVGEKEVRLYLIIWMIILLYQSPLLADVRIELNLTGLYNYSGYLVLGYYLANYSDLPAQKQKRLGMILYIAGVIITAIGTYIVCFKDKIFVDTFYQYLSLNVAIAATGIFLWLKQVTVKGAFLKKCIHSVAKHSYGIYLVHTIFIYLVRNAWGFGNVHPLLYVPCLTLICFFASWGSVYLISKLPYSKHYVG
jgi:surface polysaccharide O-acyltransferase-like enzyme